MTVRLILVEDTRARSWTPFAETRPVGELRFGAMLLRERVERWTGARAAGYLAGEVMLGAGAAASGVGWNPGPLLPFDEPGAPPILSTHPVLDRVEATARGDGDDGQGILLWLSRAAPAVSAPPPALPGDREALLVMDGTVVGYWLPHPSSREGGAGAAYYAMPYPPGEMVGGPAPSDPTSQGGPVRQEVPGAVLGWPWELVDRNAGVLSRDLEWLHGHDRAPDLPGIHVVGQGAVSLGRDARVGPGVILDVRDGPIRLDPEVSVEGPARLTGPLHLGPGCQVFGGHLSRLSAGPVCKLRGEIDTAVLVGYDNKAHDGYLGHALLGRWVNLGALTTNSDLKNDYGPVRVDLGPGPTPRDPAGDGPPRAHGEERAAHRVVDTERKKVGVFLGDHVKTGIGTVLNTGSVVGAGSNVFGGGMPPKYLPPFSWAGGGSVTPFRWDKFVGVARIVVGRRDQPWTSGAEAVLRALWDATHGGAPGGDAG